VNRNAIIGIVIAAIVVGGLVIFVVPQIMPKTTGMTIILYDADDNEVYKTSTRGSEIPLFSFALQDAAGKTVTTAVVTVSYNVAGVADGSTVSVGLTGGVTGQRHTWLGETERVVDVTGTVESEIATDTAGTWTFTYDLSSMCLSAYDATFELDFSYSLIATETDGDGDVKTTDPLVLSKHLSLTYVDTTVALSISGDLGFTTP